MGHKAKKKKKKSVFRNDCPSRPEQSEEILHLVFCPIHLVIMLLCPYYLMINELSIRMLTTNGCLPRAFAICLCREWASLVAQLVKNRPAMQKTPVWSLGREDPLEKELATHSSILGLQWFTDGRESASHAGDLGSMPGLGKSPGRGYGSPLQYSCLENNPHGQSILGGYNPWGHKQLGMTDWHHTAHSSQ